MRDLLLIGAGHSHVQVLRQHAMRPFPARVTLVVDDPVAVYSGMVPALVAGQITAHELEIDAHALARRAGCRVICARATRVDARARKVHLDGRPPIPWDVASINVGASVAGLDTPGVREHALASRPIARLVDGLDRRTAKLPAQPAVVVVGAGAGGVELAFCLEARLRARGRKPAVSLVFASEGPLPDRHARIGERIVDAAQARGIALIPASRVVAVGPESVTLSSGAVLAADLTVWVAGAASLPLGQDSGLPVDARGWIRVRDTLQVDGFDDLFAVGDCAVPASWPEIPKAGVYAVREGPVLAENLRASLEARALSTYRPQADFFGILNLGDGTAIGAKWGVPVQGAWVMGWKDRIDRAFMHRFQVLDPDGAPAPTFDLPPMPDDGMLCGGCAAKVAQQPLSRALSRLPALPDDPRIVLGPAEADDVVAWRGPGGLVVQNVDAFPAFVDDPWTVGRGAAINALSDLAAKGVDPAFATAIVTLPPDRDAEELLFQVLSGARTALDDAGARLLGGHTLTGPELVVGFAITGFAAHPLRTLGGAQPGDTLLLTRPLGTGVLLHADRAGRAPGRLVRDVLARLLEGNGPAAAGLTGLPVHAVTDVTGFGLAGHLVSMLQASRVGASVDLAALPAWPGVVAWIARGERSTSHAQNRALAHTLVVRPEAARDPRFELLFDPQTCGGLLIATPAPEQVLAAIPGSARIGRITPQREDGGWFEVLAT